MPEASAVDQAQVLRDLLNAATTLEELKSAFAKAGRYAKNRNDDALVKEFTELKDSLKKKLSEQAQG